MFGRGEPMMTRAELRQHIDTIVVVIMENRSFDHVLGHLSHPTFGNRTDVEGIRDLADNDWLNQNNDGLGIAPFWMPDAAIGTDLPHGAARVAQQLDFSPATGSFSMTGFVRAFEDEFHTHVKEPPVMGLLRPDDVPISGALAGRYAVCDRWFACLPTSTAPNRLMSMCGATEISETGVLLPDQLTVYDWLLDHGVRWRAYHAGFPFFTLMPRILPLLLTGHFRRFADLAGDAVRDAASAWPQVVFVEPEYLDAPVHVTGPCDNHPPLAMAAGEAFLARLYAALTANEERWARTVLIVTYDEHGGFWDHVSPPRVTYRHPNGAVSFKSTGPRVPAIVCGPFAPRGGVSTVLDNTSILQLIAERFGKDHEVYSPEVSARAGQGIASVSAVLSANANNGSIAKLPVITRPPGPPPTAPASLIRQGFTDQARRLRDRHQGEALAKFPELAKLPPV
jgi:phospholipase C